MMNKPTVLFLFNSSTYAMEPWLDDGGFNVVTVDYSDTDHSDTERGDRDPRAFYASIDLSQPHAIEHVYMYLFVHELADPSLVVSFAPCTDLAVSGAAHFARKREANPLFQTEAVRMAQLAARFGCPYMVENPVSVLASMWKKPCMYWHPYEFGYACPEGPHPEFPQVFPPRDLYRKKTGLWSGGGFVLPIKVDPPQAMMEQVEAVFPGHAKLGGKSARTKHIRSLTPRGFARAVYEANRDSILSSWGSHAPIGCDTLPSLTQQQELTV